MAQVNWSQDIFSRGELSPLMYSRITVNAYYNGLKTAKNVITFPQGAAGKRFGTDFLVEVTGITDYTQVGFYTFQYLNECTYLLCFIPDNILIYLEGILVATVAATGIVSSEIQNIDTTTLDARYRVTCGLFGPKDLKRAPNAANALTAAFTATTLTLTVATTAGFILPIRFTTAGVLPATTPQIRTNKTYFAYAVTTTTFELYSTAQEAKARLTPFTIIDAGTGVSTSYLQNTWTFALTAIKNPPVFDFTGGYDTITFTPAAVTGFGVIITMSAIMTAPASMTSAYAGGAFVGNGGICQIVSVTDTTHFVVNIMHPFDDVSAIPGNICFLAEPAWSNNRGWPLKCSSFQSRAIFANSELLPNGLWISVINDFDDFYSLETDADFGISWYPTSDNVNYIRFIVPYRSLTIHTNTGIYSSPLSNEGAITPLTFSMSLQDSSPATTVEPRAIDNQIVVISGNDVHSLLWDGFNSSYTSTIASVANEHLIRSPIDEMEYLDLNRAGSRYIFIINADGTMTIFQTLVAENVQGFTPAVLEQPYGNAYFRWAASSPEGRAWFLNERQIAEAVAAINITAFTATTLTAVASSFSTTDATAALFATTGTLPTSSPQINTTQYYWIKGLTADTFEVYLSQTDLESSSNPIEFSDAGTTSTIEAWPLTTKFYIEELNFNSYVDCAVHYDSTATSSLTSLPRFNAQNVLINGDGFGFSDDVVGSEVELIAHGQPVEASVIQAGFPINVSIETLPAAPPGQLGYKGTSFIFAAHVRLATLTFVETIGGTINGQPINIENFTNVIPGDPPVPITGKMEVSIMKGWSDYLSPAINIVHSEPFDIKLTGLFYKIEV